MAQKRVALVTGAGSGIGKSAALALIKDGYHVALVGRRKDQLEKTASESAAKDRALVLAADITRDADVEKVFSEVKSKFGRLDVLFNNAGIGAPAVPMEELPLETWKKVVDTNLTGIFVCTQEAIKIMKAQTPKGGRIINNGSIKPEPLMDVKHVGDAVLHMANLPLDVNVQFMTIMATKMPFVGRG